MNLTNPYIVISSIGLIPALILLIFPNPNYIIKAISTALITTSLGYISINLVAWNLSINSAEDTHGIIFLISIIFGTPISIVCGLIVLTIFISKTEKYKKVISKIFKNN